MTDRPSFTVNTTSVAAELPPEHDHRLIELLEGIRNSVVHLLTPDKTNPPASADLAIGLQTLQLVAETGLKIAEKNRVLAETQYLKTKTENILVERH